MRVEHWEEDQALSRTLDVYHIHNTLKYSLTPEYLEVVQGPEPHLIAYLTKSNLTWYGVHAYSEKGLQIPLSVGGGVMRNPSSGGNIATAWIKKNLQISENGLFLRYVRETYTNNKAIVSDIVEYATVVGGHATPEGWSKDPIMKDYKLEDVVWLPPKKPESLPAFMTASQPKVHEESAPVWSPDGRYVYAHDDEGIWRVNLLPLLMQVWEHVAPLRGVRTFSASPDGRHLLAEIDEENDSVVMLIALDPATDIPTAAKHMGKGWGSAFNYEGDKFLFMNDGGLFVRDIIDLGEASEPRRIDAKNAPSFDRDAPLVWGPNSQSIYTMSDDGIWKINVLTDEEGVWNLVLPMKSALAFSISSSGRYLLVESKEEKDYPRSSNQKYAYPNKFDRWSSEFFLNMRRYITLTDMANNQKTSYVGVGWGSVFNPKGSYFFFRNFEGTFMTRVVDGYTELIAF